MNRFSRCLCALLIGVLSFLEIAVLLSPPAAFAITPAFPSPNVLVDDVSLPARSPRVAVGNDGVLHAVWVDARDGSDGVYYSRSLDEGLTWSPSVAVDDGPEFANSREPDLAVNRTGTPIYVVYSDTRRGNSDVYAATSTDGGSSWSASVRVDDAPGIPAALRPRIGVDAAGVVYAAWEDKRDAVSPDQVYFSRSTTEGVSWTPNAKLSAAGSGQYAMAPSLSAGEAGRVLVVWQQLETVLNMITRIVAARSSDRGSTWALATVASGQPNEVQSGPDVVLASGGHAYAVWSSNLPPLQKILFAKSLDGGGTWAVPVRVDDRPDYIVAVADSPSMAAVAGRPFVTWHDLRNGNPDIFASGSADEGATWGDCPVPCLANNDARADDTGLAGSSQQFADSAGTLWDLSIVWMDDRNGGSDIYFARFDASGVAGVRVTEIQDSPSGTDEAVEITYTGWADFDFQGYELVVDGVSFDLGGLGVVPAGRHSVVGTWGGADFRPPSFGMDDNGGVIGITGPRGVEDEVRYGQRGTAPDPLPSMSSARYFDGKEYTNEWSLDPTPTLGAQNDGSRVAVSPALVLNEAYYDSPVGQESSQFIELYYRGTGSLNTAGFRVVGEATYAMNPGVTLSPADPYVSVRYSDAPALFDSLRFSGDNLYLYGSDGVLWDMVGWNTFHAVGTSICRLPAGNGTSVGYDDTSSLNAGWEFGCVPSLPSIAVGPSQTGYGDLGSTVFYNLTVRNRQPSSAVVDLSWNPAPAGWDVRAYEADGVTPLQDSNSNSLPDLTLGPQGSGTESSGFVVGVSVPFMPQQLETILTRIVATEPVSGGWDVADLTTNVAPYVTVNRTADPDTINLKGAVWGEETTITLTVRGEGLGVPGTGSNAADVVFVIDDTGSMGAWISQVKTDVDIITDSLAANVSSIRFGLVSYGDVFEIGVDLDLTGDVLAFKAAVTALVAGGGGDWPEDPDLALETAANLSWRATGASKVMVLVGDAPAHDNLHLVNVALWAHQTREIYTSAILCGSDNVAADAFNRTAQAGAGVFAQLGTPNEMADAILKGILAVIPPLDHAARDADIQDANPMVRDVLPPFIAHVPGTFVDPNSGAQRDPSYIGIDLDGTTILEWNVTLVRVDETWSVAFSVTASRAGLVPTNVFGLSRVSFLDWRDRPRAIDFPEVFVTVLALAPTTRLDVGQPHVLSTSMYVTSGTPLSFVATDRSGTGIRSTLYRVDGGAWLDFATTGPFHLALEGERSVEWYSEDNAGGREAGNFATLRVDDTPPTTTLAIGTPRYADAFMFVTSATLLTIQGLDGGVTPVGIELVEIQVDGRGWVPYSMAFQVQGEGSHLVEYRSRDRLGNEEVPSSAVIVVDDSPPALSALIGLPSREAGETWVTSRTPIDLLAFDGGPIPVGLEAIEYRTWFGAWSAFVPYSVSVTLAGEGMHIIEARAWDRLGNEAVLNASAILDDTPPIVSAAFGYPIFEGVELYVTSATSVGLAIVDGGVRAVGLASAEYRVAGSWLPVVPSFFLSGPDGPRVVEYRASDWLGNRASGSITLELDNTPPETEISRTITPAAHDAFSFSADDHGSGVARTEYRVDGTPWASYGGAFSLPPGEHVIGYRSIDNLGNVELERTLAVRIEAVISVSVNWKPFVAVVFGGLLLVAGVWSARRKPWRDERSKARILQAFSATSLPFVAAELATGLVSLFTGMLSIPPLLGLGTVVDVGILAAGLLVAVFRVHRPNSKQLGGSPGTRR